MNSGVQVFSAVVAVRLVTMESSSSLATLATED